MDIVVAALLLLLLVVTTFGAVDSRDGRDWQPRGHWQARRGRD